METQEPQIAYLYFDYSLTFTCQYIAKIKAYGTNHTNAFKCSCERKYKVAPEVVKIK